LIYYLTTAISVQNVQQLLQQRTGFGPTETLVQAAKKPYLANKGK
jgi:hypothetical protein